MSQPMPNRLEKEQFAQSRRMHVPSSNDSYTRPSLPSFMPPHLPSIPTDETDSSSATRSRTSSDEKKPNGATYGTIGDHRVRMNSSHNGMGSSPTTMSGDSSDTIVDQVNHTDALFRSLALSPDLDASFERLYKHRTGATPPSAVKWQAPHTTPVDPGARKLPAPEASANTSPTDSFVPRNNVIDDLTRTPVLDNSPASSTNLDDLAVRTPGEEKEFFVGGILGSGGVVHSGAYLEDLAHERRASLGYFDPATSGLGLTTGEPMMPKVNDLTPGSEHGHRRGTPADRGPGSDLRFFQIQAEIERLQLEQARLTRLQHNHIRRPTHPTNAFGIQPPLSNITPTQQRPNPMANVYGAHNHRQASVPLATPLEKPFPYLHQQGSRERVFTPFTPLQPVAALASSPFPPPPSQPPKIEVKEAPRPSNNGNGVPLTQAPQAADAKDHRGAQEPLNFMNLLEPSSEPPYPNIVHRIIRQGDQQASIFIQQKLKACSTNSAQDVSERRRILDAILANGFEMMTNRFGNWAFQRCLEDPCNTEERRRVAGAMRGRVVELATNCYGTHVVQKALECEEDIRLLVLSELLLGDPAVTLINKHASHVWSRIMELTWSPPVPPIFAYVNKALKGRWVELATHETGSLVVQHLFENCVQEDTRDCLEEIFDGFHSVVRDQWGSFVIQHMLEHGLPEHRSRAVTLLGTNLSQYATDAQAMKSVDKALKVCTEEAVEAFVNRLCEPGKTGRRPLLVDLALNANGSQLITQIMPLCNPDQRKRLAAAIKKHVVTLKGNKAGSKIVWMFDRMRSYDGY